MGFGTKNNLRPRASSAGVWLCALAVLAAVCCCGQQVQAPASQLERGRYLVEAVAICFECHSERNFLQPGWPIPPGRAGGGRIMYGEGTDHPMVAANISPDRATGIGAWTDQEITRAIRDGIARDGRTVNPEMPSRYFRVMSADDLRAIVIYLRSIPPVVHALPRMPPYKPAAPSPVAMDSIQLTRTSDAIRRGEFVVRLGGCETCHTPTNANGYIKGLDFAGGSVFRHGDRAAASSNLTPGPSGISYYDEQKFLQVMRTGRAGARVLNSAMPWLFYRHMTDADLKCVFAYLQALPPVQHRVDNTEPPTPCRKCGNTHGLGNQN
jgi:mono/diheme cytochrome c family protein